MISNPTIAGKAKLSPPGRVEAPAIGAVPERSPEARRPEVAGHLRLAYIIGTYPTLTTTFIDREIEFLGEMGTRPAIISIRRPGCAQGHGQNEASSRVIYLLPCGLLRLLGSHGRIAARHPLRYLGTLCFLLTRHHPDWRSWWMTLLHFGEGVLAARHIECLGATHIHAHFVDRAATLAITASRLLGLPYSVTAHANDIYVSPVLLDEKIGGATFAATCTRYNRDHLEREIQGRGSSRVHCIYHGLDTAKYDPSIEPPAHPPLLLAVGQLKEKKGFKHLLAACKRLKERGSSFQCRIVGEGPLRSVLEDQIRDLDLEGIVSLLGALKHRDVVEMYRSATIFALPCVVGADGDRDGIPNVILEAMAMKLPVVATSTSGIPEAIESGVNGRLVPPGDANALADALEELLDKPGLRRALGEEARRTVVHHFDVAANVRQLFEQFVAPRPASALNPLSTRGDAWPVLTTKL